MTFATMKINNKIYRSFVKTSHIMYMKTDKKVLIWNDIHDIVIKIPQKA